MVLDLPELEQALAGVHLDMAPLALDAEAIRPGLHCAPYVHKAIGTFPDGAVRVSPGPFNTEADIDALAGALAEIKI